jgi:predicted transcriptional regulator
MKKAKIFIFTSYFIKKHTELYLTQQSDDENVHIILKKYVKCKNTHTKQTHRCTLGHQLMTDFRSDR